MLFPFSDPFVLCHPPHVLLWSFCCPAAVLLFPFLLSKAGAGPAAAHHNNNSCRLSCLGSICWYNKLKYINGLHLPAKVSTPPHSLHRKTIRSLPRQPSRGCPAAGTPPRGRPAVAAVRWTRPPAQHQWIAQVVHLDRWGELAIGARPGQVGRNCPWTGSLADL